MKLDRPIASLLTYSRFVKFEHTLFSLPLILAGSILGERTLQGLDAGGALTWGRFGLIILAGTGARTFALAVNRIIDRRMDAQNPRTASRELPSGKMSLIEARGVLLAGLAAYAVAIAFLPPICAWLSPIPIAVFVAYPFMKRFTATCHLGVGLGLALSPLAGYAAVSGTLAGIETVLPLAAFALFWVAGFDIIYAGLDEAHDTRSGIHSLPAAVGKQSALRFSAALHVLSFLALALWCLTQGATPIAWILLATIGTLLVWQQRAAERVELAFFRINSGLGFVVLALVWSGIADG